MKPILRILAGIASVAAVQGSAQAQQTLTFDDLGPCSGSISAYQSWIQLLNPATCQTGSYLWLSPSSPSNFLRAWGGIEWSFSSGPVVFNSVYASGSGGYFLQLLSGGKIVSSTFFSLASGMTVNPGYQGSVDRVRIFGTAPTFLGVDDINFTSIQQSPVDIVNQPNAAPEPATMMLLGTGLAGLGAMARRRRRRRGVGA